MSKFPLHSVSVAGVVFDDNERVLLIRRKDNGEWQAPGGILELQESFEEGVVREIFEETGVVAEVDCLTGVYKNLAQGVVALVYRCRFAAGNPTPTAETSEVRWFTLDEGLRRMSEVFAIRVKDAIPRIASPPASRAHDGKRLAQ